MNTKVKTIVPAVIVILLFVLYKSATVFLSEWNLHSYRVLTAQVRDHGLKLTDHQWANQIQKLSSAIKWAPGNADALYEMGRNLHRLAEVTVDERQKMICKTAKIIENECDDISLFETAIDFYDEAQEKNRLAKGARFWRLVAMIALEKRQVAAGRPVKKMSADELVNELDQALKTEGRSPSILRFAGDIAANAGREEMALNYYRDALKLSLEDLELIVDRLLITADPLSSIETILPETPKAYNRLSEIMANRWRFALAESYWKRARKLEGKEIAEDEPGNLVQNGRFEEPFGSHFLDWELSPRRGVKYEAGGKGIGGLVVQLNDAPRSFFHFTQRIPFESNEHYRLTAKVKPEGRYLHSFSKFGFEIVHPYEPAVWSAGEKCVISQQSQGPVCMGLTADEKGYYTLDVEFTTPLNLREGILRLVWMNYPQTGKLHIDQVRIEPVQSGEGEPDA